MTSCQKYTINKTKKAKNLLWGWIIKYITPTFKITLFSSKPIFYSKMSKKGTCQIWVNLLDLGEYRSVFVEFWVKLTSSLLIISEYILFWRKLSDLKRVYTYYSKTLHKWHVFTTLTSLNKWEFLTDHPTTIRLLPEVTSRANCN